MTVWLLVAIEAVALALAVANAVPFGEIFRALKSSEATGHARLIVASARIVVEIFRNLFRSPLAPLLAVIAYALADEVAIEVIHRALAGQPRPFAGGARIAYHLETALVIGWPCCLAAASWRVFAWPSSSRRVVPHIAASWAGVAAAMTVSYPIGREATALVLQAVEVAGVACAVVPIVGAWRRPWARQHVAVGLLAAVEVAVALIGPWLRDVYRDWRLATVAYLVGFAALSGLLVWWLRADRLRSSTAAR